MDNRRPKTRYFLVKTQEDKRTLIVLELTAGFETNMEDNADRKDSRYKDLVNRLQNEFDDIHFVNLSMSCLGFFWNTCDELTT